MSTTVTQSSSPQPGPSKPSKKNGIRSILARFGGNKRQSAQRPSQRVAKQSGRPLTDVSNASVPNVDSKEPMLASAPVQDQTARDYAARAPSTDESELEHGADTNASTRPITPQSFLTSGSTSNLSQTRSIATGQSHASTKPTTLLSQNSDGGANRIAQPRPVSFGGGPSEQLQAAGRSIPVSAGRRDSANTTGSASQQQPMLPSSASITFSALPPPSPATSGPFGSPIAHSVEQLPPASPTFEQGIFRYPQHTQPQTRNNPHPGGVPPDNASTLTLASSMAPSLRNHAYRQDEDASVRALPPSRRESDASLQSKWSAAVLSGRVRPASVLTVGTTGSQGLAGSTPLKTASMLETEPISPGVDAQEEFVQASEVTPPSTPAAVL